jgi:phosphonate transport system substrate-binding protein
MLTKQNLFKHLLSPWLLICVLFSPSCGEDTKDGSASGSAKELSLKKVIVALKATDHPEKLLGVKDELENILSEKMKRVVEITIPTSSASVTESFRTGKIDIGYLSPTDAARNLELGAASALLARTENGKPHYKSIWVCKKEKEYSSVADLKGKPVAFASRSSEPGYLIPAWDLANRKLIGPGVALTDYFAQVLYCNGDASAAGKVLSGEAEAAAIAGYALQGGAEALSEGQQTQLKIFQEQGPVATDVLCVRSSLSLADRKLLEEAFLSMNAENPELCNRAFRGKLEVVDEREHLKVILDAIAVQKTLKP